MQNQRTSPKRLLCVLLLAGLSTFALGLDFTVALPKQLILTLRESSLFGVMNNLLIALNHFHTMDHLTGTLVLLACVWLYQRYLLSANEKKGGILLSGFFALAMLVSEAASAENTIRCLWAGSTQVLKTVLYVAGLWPLFLAGLRLLREALQRLAAGGEPRGACRKRHPFATPFVVIALCWLPFFVMKYPGGMSPDVTVQILNWQGPSIDASHPLMTTMMYGVLYQLGEALGNPNLGIFLFTLLQTLAYLAVLAYGCACMQRWGVSKLLYNLTLAAFCLSANYGGYATNLVKDVPYVIGCLLMCVLLIDFSLDPSAFWKRTKNIVLFIVAWATIWLWRRNGPLTAALCALAMLPLLFALPGADKRLCLRRLVAVAAACVALCVGIGAVPTAFRQIRPAARREVYGHMLQMAGKVVCEHPDDLTEQDIRVLDGVMAYDKIREEYDPIITDGMKFLFREDATPQQYADFRAWVLAKAREYPLDYVDAYLNLTYRLFDIRSDRGDYVRRREISHPYYIRSYTNELYNQQTLHGLDAAQEAVENWNFWTPDLPLIGQLSNIGLCVFVLAALSYLFATSGCKRALLALVPAWITVAACLGSPLVYIRYALPITASLPLWFAAWQAHARKDNALSASPAVICEGEENQ